MSRVSNLQIVECSYCPGGLRLLASRAKSEQAHHCAGVQRESHPPTADHARENLSLELCVEPLRSQRVT